MSAPENEKGFAAPTAKPKQYISDSTLSFTKNHKATQAENISKSRLSEARLAARLDDIVARAEQEIRYAMSDHRLACRLAEREPSKPARRVSIKAGRDSLAVVLSTDAEIKLWAYARRLARQVADRPFAGQPWDDGGAE